MLRNAIFCFDKSPMRLASMLSMPSDCWGGPLRATFARQSAPLHAGMFVTPVMLPRSNPALGFSSKQVMYQISARPVPATFPSSEESRAPGVVVEGWRNGFAPWRRNHFHMVHSRRTMLMWCSAADAKERKWIAAAWKDHNFRSCDCKPLEIP